ncbi:MAG TPA: hypothetical protein VHS28_04375, partial [Chloroflexota bacterium]|nr:hypothetical protein [Chloroflexota bacterium]
SPILNEVDPGGIATLSFRVTNNTDSTEEYEENIELPSGWQSVIPTGIFAVPEQNSTSRIIAIQIPPNYPAGQYAVRYYVQSRLNPGISDFMDVQVLVLRKSRISLMLEDGPSSVIAGEQYRARICVFNQSNAAADIVLHAASPRASMPVRIEPESVSLPAGGSQTVELAVTTSARTRAHESILVQVKAQNLADAGKSSMGFLNVTFDVIPRLPQKVSPYRTLPTRIGYEISGSGSENGVQAVWTGAGTVDEAGEKRVDFRFQGPDTRDTGTFGRRDEYRMGYSDRNFSVRLGDQTYGLSYLTDYLHYGRGLGFNVNQPSGLSTGGFYFSPRWCDLDRKVAGAFVGYSPAKEASLKLNLLVNSEDTDQFPGEVTDHIYSLEGTIAPTDNFRLHMEYGHSETDRPGASSDDAYRIEVNGRINSRTHYSYQTTHAGPNYFGYYRDWDSTYATVTTPLGAHTRMGVSYSKWMQNLELRPYQRTAPRESLFQVNLRQDLWSHWYTNLNYGHFSRTDDLLPSDFDFVEDPFRIGLGSSSGNCNWLLEYGTAERKDRITGLVSHPSSYSALVSYRFSPEEYVTLYADHSSRDSGGYLLGLGNHVGISATVKPMENLRVTAGYNRYSFTNPSPDTNQLDLSAVYNLDDDRTLSLRVLRADPHFEHGTSYSLIYTMPFDVPLGRRLTGCTITGRVYDGDKPDKPGIPNAVVSLNGARIATDSKGDFTFTALYPGEYYLNMDSKAIGLGRTADSRLPMLLKLGPQESRKLEIGVISAASVRGTVILQPAPVENGLDQLVKARTGETENVALIIAGDSNGIDKQTVAVPSPMPGILIEMTDGNETIRRITNSEGVFDFESLRPGKWQLKVSNHNLPPQHYIENPEMSLELHPGERTNVSIRVLPKLRRIRMLTQEPASE